MYDYDILDNKGNIIGKASDVPGGLAIYLEKDGNFNFAGVYDNFHEWSIGTDYQLRQIKVSVQAVGDVNIEDSWFSSGDDQGISDEDYQYLYELMQRGNGYDLYEDDDYGDFSEYPGGDTCN